MWLGWRTTYDSYVIKPGVPEVKQTVHQLGPEGGTPGPAWALHT